MKRPSITYLPLALACMLVLSGCETKMEDIGKWQAAGNTKKLIATTTTTDQELRVASIEALGALKAEEAVVPLANLYHDDDLYITLTAIQALVDIGTESAQQELIKALDLKTMRGRLLAVTALGNYKTVDAVDPLINALDDEFMEVATAAVISLGQLNDRKAIPALTTKVYHRDHTLKLAAIKTLHEFGGEDVARGLVPALDDMASKIRGIAIDTFVDIGDQAKPYAYAALRREGQLAPEAGLEILQRINAIPSTGDDAVWYLLADTSIKQRTRIDPAVTKQIADMGTAAVPALLEALAHSSPILRKTAARTLEDIGEPCAAQAIKTALAHSQPAAKEWFEKRGEWYGSPSWKNDIWGATTALSYSFEENPQKVAQLFSNDPETQKIVSNSTFKPQKEYIPMLIGMLDISEKIDPVNFFGLIVPQDSTFSPMNDDLNRKQAYTILPVAGEEAVFPLLAALYDENAQIADGCAKVLGTIGDKRALVPLRELLTKKVEAKENLTDSSFYAALQQLGVSTEDSLLLRIRPNQIHATRLFEQQFPKYRVMSIRSQDATAHPSQPIAYQIGYLQNKRMRYFILTFARNAEGQWIPDQPLPDQLP